VPSWLVLLSFAPNDCSAPKPDVVGSSPTAPVSMNSMKRWSLPGFPVESAFFVMLGFWQIEGVVNMYLRLFSNVCICYGDISPLEVVAITPVIT